MAENKRDPIKWIRDKAKHKYTKADSCRICACTEKLELHHYHSLTALFEKWAKSNGHRIDTDDQVMEVREAFIAQHEFELYEDTVTLCNTHHKLLHKVYGIRPLLSTTSKQRNWVSIQRQKNGLDPEPNNQT